MAADMPTRPWSSLGEEERARLLADYQEALGRDGPTCNFDLKLERMQRWLAARGVSISEVEIRGRPRRD